MAIRADDRPGSDPGVPWAERDAPARRAMLDGILAQISHDALQGEGLEAVLQGIVDSLARRLPVAIASILLVDAGGTLFVQEVWAGDLNLGELPGATPGQPWSVQIGATGRCARTGQPQLIDDVSADPDYVAGNPGVLSEYLVPIHHRGVLLGVLNLESTHVDFFTAEACAVFDAIAAQVAGAIHLAQVARELELANRKLEALSMLDGLTGIANRRHFDQHLQADWARMTQTQQPLALLLIDADCFKALNDASGHLYGDECLRELARLCAAMADAATDLVARYGGEEIALLLPGRDLRRARAIGEKLRRSVQARGLPHPASTAADVVTVSVGAAVARPADGGSPDRLIAAADRAMYAAKARGRNRVATRVRRATPPAPRL